MLLLQPYVEINGDDDWKQDSASIRHTPSQ